MTDIYVKLSEMDRPAKPVNDTDLVFIAQKEESTIQSKAMALSDLRSLLNFENAFTSTTQGLTGTVAGQIFYVYTDGTKTSVFGYTNRNGIAEQILDGTGNPVKYYTQTALATLVDTPTYVNSLTELRAVVPKKDKQIYILRNYKANGVQYSNGGTFIYDITDTTTADNTALTVVTSSGARLKREIQNGQIEIDWFFNPGTDTVDYSLTINRASAFVAVTGTEWWQTYTPTTPGNLTLFGPGQTRPCKTPIVLRMLAVSWNFRDTILDFTTGAQGQTNISVVYAGRSATLSNLRVYSPRTQGQTAINVSSSSTNIQGIAAASSNFNSVYIAGHAIGWQLGANCYLNNWFQCQVNGAALAIQAPRSSNAGETLVWNKCLFTNGSGAFFDIGMPMTFNDCSFDYSGYKTEAEQLANANTKGMFNIDNVTVIMRGCGNEYGNSNSRWSGPVWMGSGIIKLFDCQWLTPTSSTIEQGETTPHLMHNYYFQDTSSDLSSRVYLDGLTISNADLIKWSGSWTNGCFIEMKRMYPNRYKDIWRNYNLGSGGNILPVKTPSSPGFLEMNRCRVSGGVVSSPTATDLFTVSVSGNNIIVTTTDTTKVSKTISFFARAKPGNWYGAQCSFLADKVYTGAKFAFRAFGVVGYPDATNAIKSISETGTFWPGDSLDITDTLTTTPNCRLTGIGLSEYLPLTPTGTEWVRVGITLTGWGINSGDAPAILTISNLSVWEVDIAKEGNYRVW